MHLIFIKNMTKIIRYIIVPLVALAVSVSFTACDDDHPDDYFVPGGAAYSFVGSWELVAVNGTMIYPEEYTTYQLWENGSGVYGFYYGPRWNEVPLSWTYLQDANGYMYLFISSNQGYFRYEVSYLSYSTMVIVDIDTNNQLEYQRF